MNCGVSSFPCARGFAKARGEKGTVKVHRRVDIAQTARGGEGRLPGQAHLVQDPVGHCLEHTVAVLTNGERAPLEEFKQITKYL